MLLHLQVTIQHDEWLHQDFFINKYFWASAYYQFRSSYFLILYAYKYAVFLASGGSYDIYLILVVF